MIKKENIKKISIFIAWRALGAFVFVAVAGTSLWALAAFTEPSVSPSASVQDFAKNILGANNADNSFDSSGVTANADGSVVERLEELRNGDYITCANTYSYSWGDSSTRPVCPTGFVSVSDGAVVVSSGIFNGWRMCCLPR